MMPKTLSNKGFTLIEMLVVISIIAILALMAMPSQLNSINQKKVKETIELVEPFKANIRSFYELNGDFPEDNVAAAMPDADKIIGNYLTSLTVEEGVMHLTFGNKLKSLEGQKLSIYPVYVDGSPTSPISWICGLDQVPDGMTAAGSNQTNVKRAYLPLSCR